MIINLFRLTILDNIYKNKLFFIDNLINIEKYKKILNLKLIFSLNSFI